MGFDYMQEMRKPDEKMAPLQPSLLFYARESFLGYDDKSKGYYSFLNDNAQIGLNQASRIFKAFNFHIQREPDISRLPVNAWELNLNFTLASSYIAKDDAVFSPTENPVRLEKIIGLPYVSPAAWKGLLRTEIEFQSFHKIDKETTERIFGTDTVESDKSRSQGLQGRLCFFPTFFKNIGLDIINPHKRETKTDASGPLTFEVVPKNSKGQLQLVYISFGQKDDLDTALLDLETVAKGLKELLLSAGISAKRTVGYGLVKDPLDDDSFFQIHNERYLMKPESGAKTESQKLPHELFQDNGNIISYEKFCSLYTKKGCKDAFGNKDRIKAYHQLSAGCKSTLL